MMLAAPGIFRNASSCHAGPVSGIALIIFSDCHTHELTTLTSRFCPEKVKNR